MTGLRISRVTHAAFENTLSLPRKSIMLDFEPEDITDTSLLAQPALVKLEADFLALTYLASQPGTLLAVIGVTLVVLSLTSL